MSASLLPDPTSGEMILVIDRVGSSIRYIAKADPLIKKGCKRQDCFPCTSGGGNCEKNWSGYRIECETCQLAGVVSLYEGETGRNGYTRGKEHLDALRLEDEENALWKHCLIQHNGEKAKFSMKVLGVFYTCLVRQVNEGVQIQRSRAQCLMNSKSEFHKHPVVRIVPLRGLREEQGEARAGERQGRGTGRGRGRGQERGRGPRGAGRRQGN